MTVTSNLHYGLAAWSNHSFALGERCSNAGNAYQCTTAGSSTAAPTGTGSSINNGGAAVFKWLSATDYSDLVAWASMINGLGTTAQPYILQCWNDGEIVLSSSLNLTVTASATNNITIRPAPGEAWNDNANVRTNAFAYNPANGVAVKATNDFANNISIGTDAVFIQDMQFWASAGNQRLVQITNTGAAACQVDRCIIQSSNTHTAFYIYSNIPASGNALAKLTNSMIISISTLAQCLQLYQLGGMYSCTVVSPSDITTTGDILWQHYGGPAPIKNCAFYGFSSLLTAGSSFAFTSCATDLASPPSGVTQVTPFSSQFQVVTTSGRDFRLKSGAGLIDTGANDGTGLTTDASKTARGTLWDIGAWEAASAGPPPYRARVVRWG